MARREEIYKGIKLAGLVSFIPIVLFLGPYGGYLIGEYLKSSFGFPDIVSIVFLILGLIAGIYETIKIIRICYRNFQT